MTSDFLTRVKELEQNGFSLYLMGGLAAMYRLQNGNSVAPSVELAPRVNASIEAQEETPVEELKDIDAAVEKIRKSPNFERARAAAVDKLWDFRMKSGLFDRLAAAVVLGIITKKVSRNITACVENFKEKNPAFASFPFIVNRLRAAYRAAGYNWTEIANVDEPAPKKTPFEQTDVGRACARIEAGGR